MSVPLMPIFKRAYWSLAGLGGVYVMFLFIGTIPWIQRQALYLQNVNTCLWHNLGEAEQWGFLDNQVHAFNISTLDAETLYAWHILPIGAISRYDDALTSAKTDGDYTTSKAFELLQDKNSKLVIKFHGNAGHVGQGWRTDTYRAITAANNENLHVLAVDYRGFGHSTGSPTEATIIADGIATVHWALNVAKIPPERIVILGQSLGTAVTIAVAEHFAVVEKIDFAGLVLIAGFSDLTTLLQTYAIGHAIPVFSPLRAYPRLLNFFSDRIVDKWPSWSRLRNLVRASTDVDISLIHARNDYDIPWTHSRTLFNTAANATSEEELSVEDIEAAKEHREIARGGFVDSWKAAAPGGGIKKIKFTLLRDGGHNRIMTYSPVTKAVFDILFGK